MIVVDGATHSQKDGVEGNGGSLKVGAEAFGGVYTTCVNFVFFQYITDFEGHRAISAW